MAPVTVRADSGVEAHRSGHSVVFVAHALLCFDGPSVELASRRRVTTRGVQDRFADAVAGRPVATDR